MMDSFDAYRRNLLELIPEPHSPEASVWVVAASDYVFEVLGADSEIGRKLSQVRFSPHVSSVDGRVPVNWADQFEDARRWALGLLDTAESKTQ